MTDAERIVALEDALHRIKAENDAAGRGYSPLIDKIIRDALGGLDHEDPVDRELRKERGE